MKSGRLLHPGSWTQRFRPYAVTHFPNSRKAVGRYPIMEFRAPKPKIALKERIPELDLPVRGRKRRSNRLLLAGLPMLGLIALAMLKSRRQATMGRTLPEASPRQPIDPSLGAPTEHP